MKNLSKQLISYTDPCIAVNEQTESEDLKTQLIFLQDDYAKLKGITLRNLRSDLMLLEEALNALNKGKVYVTQDHLERVIASIKLQIDKLSVK